ncbi:DNA topoisomerase II [Spraguea lophii 42_110]|uniref:DNA topoisomerase 2 n=1 Tax=Spraguea lophii (strain 42_110) TaxID=1358809 RepID=S7XSP8_SPRLO|nr:DNA topoisomerase II [Spraguea lophii 42_110]
MKKQKTVEELYQKKTPIEHILLRPDTYIGSVECEEKNMYILSDNKIVSKNITFVPGLYKIFDEIIVNAADNKIRDSKMNCIKVDIDEKNGVISVYNNGDGIPVKIHAKEKIYVPELIFGQLLTSSNYDDDEKKVTGGRNGYGAKLCNIFSEEFVVETVDKKEKLYYYQRFTKNMSKREDPVIKNMKDAGVKEEFTKITFKPDFKRFNMKGFDKDILSLLKKRVYDLAGIVKKVDVYLNDKKIEIKNFKEYISYYEGEHKNILHEIPNDRWEVAVLLSDDQFQQVSFVNSICTTKGGSHVNFITDQIVDAIIENFKKKEKSVKIKPQQVKRCLFVFINSLIENPAFDSQTKENLTLRASAFGSACKLSDAFLKKIINSEIMKKVTESAKAVQNKELTKTDGSKNVRYLDIEKLEDANRAGTVDSYKCSLILTEGDSAKTFVMSGIGLVGKDHYGVFPLKGKLLNVREASHKQIMENKELINIKKIIGLKQGKEYKDVKDLRYGHIIIMTDQDHDGSHIKGLLINFFDFYFPSLLKIPGFLQEFITPIVRVTQAKKQIDFFTIPEYEEWKNNNTGFTAKYFKGLGTNRAEDARYYFRNLDRHVKDFFELKQEDREMVELAFSKKKTDDRKTWLKNYVPGTFLDNSQSKITISDFVNKELILFSMADNIRSIPSVIDGMKPGQRKVLFGCFKRNLTNPMKVAQLVGYIAQITMYHHGEQSLASTIINLASDFVGSTNINILYPDGQFGSRIKGGKDAASPRYINTKLMDITKTIFCNSDEPILNFLVEENQSIEPNYYIPIIPMVLVNGSEGIGTGWSTCIPNYNPKDIVDNLLNMMEDKEPEELVPFYKSFQGTITKIENNRYKVSGKYELYGDTLEISELPVGTWTETYKLFLQELRRKGEIKDFSEYHTNKTVYFSIKLDKNKDGIEKRFKLNTIINTSNMVCFDKNGQIKRYKDTSEILKEYYFVRLKAYGERRSHLIKSFEQEIEKIDNLVRFIKEVVENTLIISKRKRADIEEELVRKEYKKYDDSYNYLLTQQLLSLTEERILKLQTDKEKLEADFEDLLSMTTKDMWKKDLIEFMDKYNKFEEMNKKELEYDLKNRKGIDKMSKKKTRNKKHKMNADDMLLISSD